MTNFSSCLVLSGLLMLASVAQAQIFAPVVTYSAGNASFPHGLVVADVNSDGKPDIVTADANHAVEILFGIGNGTFQPTITYPTGSNSSPYGVAVNDVNGDDQLDIITANSSSNTVGVLLNTGGGVFQPIATYSTGSSLAPQSVALADFNGDNNYDIVVAKFYNTVEILLGAGNGTFQYTAAYPTGNNGGTRDVKIADINNDGKPDLLATNFSSNTIGVLLGNSNGTFQPVVLYSTGNNSNPSSLTVADMNADGISDLVTANYSSNTVGILKGNGNGTFQPITSYYAGSNITSSSLQSLAVGDIDRDGKPDIVAGNTGTSTVGVLLSNSIFLPVTTYSSGNNSFPYGVAVADVNGDTRLDIITANSTGTVGVLLSTTVLAARATLPGTSATLHPNPTSTSTTLTVAGLPASVAQVQATLFDATGRTVGQQQLAAAQGTARAEVPTAGLAAGLYVLRLTAHDAQGQPIGSLPSQRLGVQ